MHKHVRERVVFYSKQDMASGFMLSKGENILRAEFKELPNNINDILELHHIKQYIDNKVFLNVWSEDDINIFNDRVREYGKCIGKFISSINDSNIMIYYKELMFEYIDTFWLLINNQKIFKKISSEKIEQILNEEPYQINTLLKYKGIVEQYDKVIRDFFLFYKKSAEILLLTHEIKKTTIYLPKSLTLIDKENIISNYIESESCNSNYLLLIQNAKKKEFRISDKIRLKAKRKYEEENNRFFDDKSNSQVINTGVSISYRSNIDKIKESKANGLIEDYIYSLDYIKNNTDYYSLYFNFKFLFEYLDNQNRINLISKKNQICSIEELIGIRYENEYFCGMSFLHSEITSYAQILTYSEILSTIDIYLENILEFVYTSFFTKNYGFADNASLSMPPVSISALEKVRLLAPELESVLKQYKIFVEDNCIDFDLLQMSSSPSAIKDIPSLNENKYIYINVDNKEAALSSHFFFSDQTLLSYVEPFKEKRYHSFFDLLQNESNILFHNYDVHQVENINYLIKNKYLSIDEDDFIKVINRDRIFILKDLYENEASSFYHYPPHMQEEAMRMYKDDFIYFESTLLSKPEQNYFNYYLNKSEFTNGLDLRNSYLHGTQARPSETEIHERAYLEYLKLLTLILLKIEDDLLIDKNKNTNLECA